MGSDANTLRKWFSKPREMEIEWEEVSARWKIEYSRTQNKIDLPTQWVELQANDRFLHFTVQEEGWLDPIGERAWWEYEGESRFLSFLLAHRTLLKQLQNLYSIPWQARRFVDKSQLNMKRRTVLKWNCFKLGDNSESLSSGLILTDTLTLEQLEKNQRWCPSEKKSAEVRRLNCAGTSSYRNLNFHFNLVYRVEPFSVVELGEFEVGDIMVVGKRQRVLEETIFESEPLGVWWRTSVSYLATNQLIIGSEMNVLNEDDSSSLEKEASQSLGELPVNVSFTIASVTLPLSEVLSIQEGYVINLNQKIENLEVKVLANGRLIGRGDLIAIDDLFGVRLKELNCDGVQ